MSNTSERGENYITEPLPVEVPEFALTSPKTLDFQGKVSVNPEDATGGTPMDEELETTTTVDQHASDELLLTSIAGLEHLFAETANVTSEVAIGVAVSYLRVSDPRQLNTAADIDQDGNSIATQREWVGRKSKEMRTQIVREFVEPGQSAQTIDKRKEFQKLLRYIEQHPEVKYVIIYMRSRVFRNHLDAAIIKRTLRERGVELISAKENFGDGYMGDAMEAITDVVNELQVRMSGEDIKVKMAHKVERGGTVGRAKLGYKNARKEFNGRLVNTIDVDEERAPLITWAFEQYATGQFSVAQLAAMLEDQGLTTRATSVRAEGTLSVAQLANILGDPYYTGVIRYKGKLYPGRHKPLISKELFLAVQKVLASRNRRGDRDRVHFHFLRGLLYCAQCERNGRSSRLVYAEINGNGGTYEYYVCTGKQRGVCDMRWIRLKDLEKAVGVEVAAERFTSEEMESVRVEVNESLHHLQITEHEEREALTKQLQKLEGQEERLIELAADGVIDSKKLRERLEAVTLQVGAIKEKLSRTDSKLRAGTNKVHGYIDLLERPGELYQSVEDGVRRDLLLALFNRILVDATDEDEVHLAGHRTELNGALHDWRSERGSEPQTGTDIAEASDTTAETKGASRITAEGSLSDFFYQPISTVGSNKGVMVAGTGFEPATSGL